MNNNQAKTLKKSKAMKLAIGSALVLSALIQNVEAREICANCYWGKSCGSISVTNVPGAGSCPNGEGEMGILWTDGNCAHTGGLSVGADNSDKFKSIYDNPDCEFGR